jgi:hypothetical protein
VFVWAKSPLADTPERPSGVDPLVIVTVCPVLSVPTACAAKVNAEDDRVTPGTVDGVVGVELFPHAMAPIIADSTIARRLKDRMEFSTHEQQQAKAVQI